jgi:hypothetical protein
MVRGLEKFREYFEAYPDRYVLIGGTAAALAMEQLAGEFRATKDLDIVLTVETIDPGFVKAFWRFVRDGGYEHREKAKGVQGSLGNPQFYRFSKPQDKAFPEMLELFSRVPDTITFSGEGHLTPIPPGDEASSLSAILLNDDYYNFLHDHTRTVNGLSFVGAECLIPLKARAYLDLYTRKETGAAIDSNDVKKHKNDIFRLYAILNPQDRHNLADHIKKDLQAAFQLIRQDVTIDLKALGLRGKSVEDILKELEAVYRVK